ncbi:DUF4158 domain-containing protein, partial [Nocardia asiatica]
MPSPSRRSSGNPPPPQTEPRLREFPEIGREELFRFFTLSPADLAFVDPGRGRGPADRLGIAIALCTLPWLGFVPDRVVTAPRNWPNAANPENTARGCSIRPG